MNALRGEEAVERPAFASIRQQNSVPRNPGPTYSRTLCRRTGSFMDCCTAVSSDSMASTPLYPGIGAQILIEHFRMTGSSRPSSENLRSETRRWGESYMQHKALPVDMLKPTPITGSKRHKAETAATARSKDSARFVRTSPRHRIPSTL